MTLFNVFITRLWPIVHLYVTTTTEIMFNYIWIVINQYTNAAISTIKLDLLQQTF